MAARRLARQQPQPDGSRRAIVCSSPECGRQRECGVGVIIVQQQHDMIFCLVGRVAALPLCLSY